MNAAAGAETTIDYIGDELTLFGAAHNWKRYMRSALAPYLAGDVAEVGAGLGGTTRALAGVEHVASWTCIEPDPAMADEIAANAEVRAAYSAVRVHRGTLSDLPNAPMFDTIIYIDVLEHIDDDRSELAAAQARLRPGGRIVVLCPAWQFLYSPFDKAVGHFRRHNKRSLRAVAAGSGLREVTAFYLDSVGFLASLANKLALRQSMPTASQIRLWDSFMVPVSRLADRVVARSFGKSVILVWAIA